MKHCVVLGANGFIGSHHTKITGKPILKHGRIRSPIGKGLLKAHLNRDTRIPVVAAIVPSKHPSTVVGPGKG